ncbi:hypothetical protein RJV04_005134, partial [Salmonella enterica]|nr:hypothetical protein [Salmonella enterica]
MHPGPAAGLTAQAAARHRAVQAHPVTTAGLAVQDGIRVRHHTVQQQATAAAG